MVPRARTAAIADRSARSLPDASKATSKRPVASAARSKRLTLRRSTPRVSRRTAELREAIQPHFRLDDNGAVVPDLRAAAAIVYNPETGSVLWEENSQALRSIASITKVMTAAAEVARRNRAQFAAVWLQAPMETLAARVAARTGDASDATVEVVDRQLGYDLGQMDWPRVDAGGTPAETLARIRGTVPYRFGGPA